jgi:3-deoxy-D-manno-octulosonate 8-phosphate phosphatase KdsC-like HAD superfamily phosphatase
VAPDRPIWLTNLMNRLDLSPHQVAPVGDSTRDVARITAIAHGFYVGHTMLEGLVAQHRPDGNMFTIAEFIVSLTRADQVLCAVPGR